jgi:hypothetical protein
MVNFTPFLSNPNASTAAEPEFRQLESANLAIVTTVSLEAAAEKPTIKKARKVAQKPTATVTE